MKQGLWKRHDQTSQTNKLSRQINQSNNYQNLLPEPYIKSIFFGYVLSILFFKNF